VQQQEVGDKHQTVARSTPHPHTPPPPRTCPCPLPLRCPHQPRCSSQRVRPGRRRTAACPAAPWCAARCAQHAAGSARPAGCRPHAGRRAASCLLLRVCGAGGACACASRGRGRERSGGWHARMTTGHPAHPPTYERAAHDACCQALPHALQLAGGGWEPRRRRVGRAAERRAQRSMLVVAQLLLLLLRRCW
jgi:hypothetical protein